MVIKNSIKIQKASQIYILFTNSFIFLQIDLKNF